MDDLKKKRRGWWWKIPLGLLFLLLIVVFVVILNLNPIVHSQLNRMLKDSLVAGGHLDAVAINLRGGQIDFTGLSIASPPGFGKKDFFQLNSLSVAVDPGSLFDDVLVVRHLNVNSLALILERDKHGRLNVKALLPGNETSQRKGDTVATDETSPAFPAVLIRSLSIDNLSVALIDELSGEQWTAHFRIDLNIDDLHLEDLSKPEVLLRKVVFSLSDVSIDQPPGLGPDHLLTLKKLLVATNDLKLLSPQYDIRKISLEGLDAKVTVDKKGVTNLTKLSDALFGHKTENSRPKDDPTEKRDQPTSLPIISFAEINVVDGSLFYKNTMKMNDPLSLQLNAITADVSGLRLFDKDNIANPAAAGLSFEVAQPEGLPTAYFGALATVGPVGEGVPPVNAQLRLIGLKLDTLGARVPQAVRTALGASGLDIGMTLALDNDSVKLQADVLTDKNIRYTAIKVQGSLSSPRVEVGKFMAGFNRVAGWLNNAKQGGLSASFDIAKTGVNVSKNVGTGAYKLGKHLGQNLFEIGTGLVTVNGQRLNKGIAGTTGGTTGQINELVRGTGSTTAGGLKGSVGSLKGNAILKNWDDGILTRYHTSMERAQELLAEMAYPPVTK